MVTSKNAQDDLVLINVLNDVNSTEREKQKAFEKIYSRYQNQLMFFFSKNIKDSETAEDLKMLTFEKVHMNIANYDSSKAVFSTWLYNIAKNVLIDHKRKEKFEVLSIDSLAYKTSNEHEGLEFQIKGDSMTPEQVMIGAQILEAVNNAIGSIKNEKVRRLMQYRFIDRLSFEEIAEREGVEANCSTIRVNAMRGQKILQELLSQA